MRKKQGHQAQQTSGHSEPVPKPRSRSGSCGPGNRHGVGIFADGDRNELVLNKGDGAIILLKAREVQPD